MTDAPPLKPLRAAGSLFQVISDRPYDSLAVFATGVLPLPLIVALQHGWRSFFGDEQTAASTLFSVALMLAATLLVVSVSGAWLRLATNAAERTWPPMRLGYAELRLVFAAFSIQSIGVVASMPIALLSVPVGMINRDAGLVTMMIVPMLAAALVWARLGPSLALGVLENRLLVTASWRPTKALGWRLYAAWVPFVAGLVCLNVYAVVSVPDATPPSGDVHLPSISAAILVSVAGNCILAFACATHAYVATHLIASKRWPVAKMMS